MQNDNDSTRLLDNRYFTLVIRLLIDKYGNIQQGNLIDLDEKIVGQFRQVDEVPDLIRAWLQSSFKKSASSLD